MINARLIARRLSHQARPVANMQFTDVYHSASCEGCADIFTLASIIERLVNTFDEFLARLHVPQEVGARRNVEIRNFNRFAFVRRMGVTFAIIITVYTNCSIIINLFQL